MSWIVKNTIKNRLQIKKDALDSMNVGSDSYLDLIDIEEAILKLYTEKLITDDELTLLRHVASGSSIRSTVPPLNMKKSMMYEKLNRVCDRIAFFLGGHFTDDGYIDYIQSKYKLDDSQLEILKNTVINRNKSIKETISE